MDLQKVGWESIDWIELAQARDRWRALVNAIMNLRVP
jgi:CRISPR/Cas system-associated protein Cas7 (RAMP superfamily)